MGTKYDYSEGATYQSESTPITIGKIPAGDYKIKAVSGDLEGEYSYTTTPGTQEITVTVAQPVWSIIYDKSLASDPAGCLTYAGLCEGFTPIIGGSDNANEGSWAEGNGTLFDAIKVGYLNGSTFVEQSKSKVAGSTSYNCFTRIPKIYQRVTDISDAGDNSKVKLDLSLKPFSGATLHPAFIMDGVELTYKDIGRYQGSVSSSKLMSVSDKYAKEGTNLLDFRTYARANGENYGVLSYYDWDLINKLILLGLKSFNTQAALGQGYTNGKSGPTSSYCGSTNNRSWMYGDTTSVSSHVSVFGIEDWWGANSQLIDNFLIYTNTIFGDGYTHVYAGNSSSPSDDKADMTEICVFSGISSTPLTCHAGLNNFFIGETTGGSYEEGLCDSQAIGGAYDCAEVGGSQASSSKAGAFCVHYTNNDMTSYQRSSRLVHWE